jgi:hypothetical protein
MPDHENLILYHKIGALQPFQKNDAMFLFCNISLSQKNKSNNIKVITCAAPKENKIQFATPVCHPPIPKKYSLC